jgi:hypothetical protein
MRSASPPGLAAVDGRWHHWRLHFRPSLVSQHWHFTYKPSSTHTSHPTHFSLQTYCPNTEVCNTDTNITLVLTTSTELIAKQINENTSKYEISIRHKLFSIECTKER